MRRRAAAIAAVALVPLAAALGSEHAGGTATAVPHRPVVTDVHWNVEDITLRSGTVHLARQPDVPLHGTRWTVTALGVHGTASSSPPENADAHLTFDRRTGKVTGSLGCNRVSAQATVSDSAITLGAARTTRMMCDASLMHTEKSLLRFFGGTVSYRIDHRTLTLTSENGETVTAVAGK